MPCLSKWLNTHTHTQTIFTNIQLCYNLNSFQMTWAAAKSNTEWQVWRFAMATGVCDGYTTVLTEVERQLYIHTYTHSPSNLASTQQINFKNIKSVCEYIFNLLPQCAKHISSRTLRYRWQHNGSMPITHLSAQFRLLWKLQCQGYFRSASTHACRHTQASGDDCELVLKHLSSATIGSFWESNRKCSFQYLCELKSTKQNERYSQATHSRWWARSRVYIFWKLYIYIYILVLSN